MDSHKLEPIKRMIEKATGVGIPTQEAALSSVRVVKPRIMKFEDDGYIPNNPTLGLYIYRKAVRLNLQSDPAAILEVIFNAHGWADAWRNGIYDFVHYHSRIHEVLGIARGTATLRIGGNKGRSVSVQAGDVIVIPAGTGHECLKASPGFLVVGAYPSSGTYDECRGSFQERQKAKAAVRRVPVPTQHPVYGKAKTLW